MMRVQHNTAANLQVRIPLQSADALQVLNQQEVNEQLERAVDEHGHTVDDHGYGDEKYRSPDCDSYPDDSNEFPDEDYQKWLLSNASIKDLV